MKITINIPDNNLNKEETWDISVRLSDTRPSAQTIAAALLILATQPKLFDKLIQIISEEYGQEYVSYVLRLFSVAAVTANTSLLDIIPAEIPVVPVIGVKQ